LPPPPEPDVLDFDASFTLPEFFFFFSGGAARKSSSEKPAFSFSCSRFPVLLLGYEEVVDDDAAAVAVVGGPFRIFSYSSWARSLLMPAVDEKVVLLAAAAFAFALRAWREGVTPVVPRLAFIACSTWTFVIDADAFGLPVLLDEAAAPLAPREEKEPFVSDSWRDAEFIPPPPAPTVPPAPL